MEKVVEVQCKNCGQKAKHVTRYSDIPQLSNEVVDVYTWCDNCQEYDD